MSSKNPTSESTCWLFKQIESQILFVFQESSTKVLDFGQNLSYSIWFSKFVIDDAPSRLGINDMNRLRVDSLLQILLIEHIWSSQGSFVFMKNFWNWELGVPWTHSFALYLVSSRLLLSNLCPTPRDFSSLFLFWAKFLIHHSHLILPYSFSFYNLKDVDDIDCFSLFH